MVQVAHVFLSQLELLIEPPQLPPVGTEPLRIRYCYSACPPFVYRSISPVTPQQSSITITHNGHRALLPSPTYLNHVTGMSPDSRSTALPLLPSIQASPAQRIEQVIAEGLPPFHVSYSLICTPDLFSSQSSCLTNPTGMVV